MPMQVTIAGGGMIVHDQLLPSFYQLERLGLVNGITVCARHEKTLHDLKESEPIRRAFPRRKFRSFLKPYEEAFAEMPPRNIAVIALPDQLHFDAVMKALEAGLLPPIAIGAAGGAKFSLASSIVTSAKCD